MSWPMEVSGGPAGVGGGLAAPGGGLAGNEPEAAAVAGTFGGLAAGAEPKAYRKARLEAMRNFQYPKSPTQLSYMEAENSKSILVA